MSGDVRGSGKEQALYLWRKVLRCLQQIDPIAFNNITTILTAQSNLRGVDTGVNCRFCQRGLQPTVFSFMSF